ncbi:ABC transporter permease [Actinomyces sp. B33]|uniref:ABC transporter permease n=1 Tax=Actinomyces sp. B33 TaxID=2942131 RepID=UPI0023427956|nr:ABC transporter permease [Actinomyces sp. B33]MDC4232422.1 ABC transporter permease [Actinomyces sp. B33]
MTSPLPTTAAGPGPEPAPRIRSAAERRPGSGWDGLGSLAWSSFFTLITNPFSLGFSIGLPIFMYLMFGTNASYADHDIGHGNVAAAVLINMAIYGVIMTASSMGANVSLERVSGVSRLFAMTPISSAAIIAARVIASVMVSGVVIAILFAVGASTGSRMDAGAWAASALIIVASTIMPTALGLAAGFLVRSDGVFALTSIVSVVGSFLSGMFIPLEQMGRFFTALAPWSPFYGMMKLAQTPLFGWENIEWQWAANWLAWTALLAVVAIRAQSRDTAR